ncbi:restriction endonuclease subunit S [Chroococcus sp. FPU101]|uniref:restriction endonuclease subunit S n=1 Tax=Chroococcus sp. FPU101 TaxID=1974212 RepID=UPI001A8DD328|nr:restriction endonuclease subunit S [Chroococcus sp. FPU101]
MINMGEIFAYSRINNIRMGRVPLSQKEANSYLLEPNDLLFARQSLVRSGAGKCSIFLGDSESVTWESHIIRARLNKNIACPQFYYYFFNSILGRQAIDSIVEQVAAAGIRGSDLAKLPVPFPPLPEQEAIAHILGTLDDKIELNQQMNQTLEAMARAIFKSWFVDFDPVRAKMEGRQPVGMDAATAEVFPDSFEESALGLIPKGWRVGTISDLGKIVTGKTPSTKISKYFGGNIPFITPSDMDGRKIMRKTARYLTKEGANSVQTAQIPAESILVSCIGSDMGKVTCTARSSVTNQQINSIIVYKKYSKEYVYYNLSSRKIELLNLAGGGSAVPILNKGHFSIIDILLPNEKLLRNFEKLANLISIKIEKNDEQSETLTNLRDILLSKLISGEIRVKEAEKLLEAVA